MLSSSFVYVLPPLPDDKVGEKGPEQRTPSLTIHSASTYPMTTTHIPPHTHPGALREWMSEGSLRTTQTASSGAEMEAEAFMGAAAAKEVIFKSPDGMSHNSS